MMNSEHILDWLERGPLHELSAAERAQVRTHCAACPACRQAYAAAQLAQTLCEARAAIMVEPPPFFATRVLAAARAQHMAAETPLFARYWQAARGLVAGMALAVVFLVGATWWNDAGLLPEVETSAAEYFSSEAAFAQYVGESDEPGGPLDDAQVLNVLYDTATAWEEQ
jgi:hypothetical protein